MYTACTKFLTSVPLCLLQEIEFGMQRFNPGRLIRSELILISVRILFAAGPGANTAGSVLTQGDIKDSCMHF